MKLTPIFLPALILMFGSLSPSSAQFISSPNAKTVFKQVVVDGFTVTEAVKTVVVTDAAGVVTAKRQTEKVVPDGAGGFTKSETQETTEATPDGTGSFTVVSSSDLEETTLDSSEEPTGAPVTTNNPSVTVEDVIEPDIWDSTELVEIDEELVIVIVISPL